MTPLAVDHVVSIERFRSLEPEWRLLEKRVAPTVPFVMYDWAAAWWTHLHESRSGVQDKLSVRTVRSSEGDIVAIAPTMLTCRPGHGPLSSREFRYFGADPNITELKGMLVSSEDLAAAHVALLDDLNATRSTWDWMVLTLPVDDGLQAAVGHRFPGFVVNGKIPVLHLNLAPSWEEFKAKLGRNIKESLRRCYNAPKRDGVSLEFEVIDDYSDVRPAIQDFFRLHSARATLTDTVRHNDVFGSLPARNFLVDVSQRYARLGAFRAFRLKVAGEVVATRLGFVLGDNLYLYYSGFDPSFGKYSVMTTVLCEAIKYAIAKGYRIVNLSTGADESKLRWSPVQTLHQELLIVSPSLRGRLVHATSKRARTYLSEGVLARVAGSLFARRQA
jgi:CelD/BcsL family acetyltransferase involved in cellulose biosynthesis